MVKASKSGSSKRYGVRYGRTLRKKVDMIEAELKKKHTCPYCSFDKVKRVSAGIWQCSKCNAKFTGRAYTPGQKTAEESSLEE